MLVVLIWVRYLYLFLINNDFFQPDADGFAGYDWKCGL
jgi:hypothetical protein